MEKANFDSQAAARAHFRMAAILRRRDLNFFKGVFLDRPDLPEADQLQQREKCYHDFNARCSGTEQIRKTEASAARNALQNRIDLLRNTKTLAENLLNVLSRFDAFYHRLESANQLKDSNLAQPQRFLDTRHGARFSHKHPLLFKRAQIQFSRRFLEFFVLDQLPN